MYRLAALARADIDVPLCQTSEVPLNQTFEVPLNQTFEVPWNQTFTVLPLLPDIHVRVSSIASLISCEGFAFRVWGSGFRV